MQSGLELAMKLTQKMISRVSMPECCGFRTPLANRLFRIDVQVAHWLCGCSHHWKYIHFLQGLASEPIVSLL
jgi:hypothetical protein